MPLAGGMVRTYSILSRAIQFIGGVVLMGSFFLAIVFLRDGDKLTALVCATMTLVSAAFIILAGWMRKRMKVWSDSFHLASAKHQ